MNQNQNEQPKKQEQKQLEADLPKLMAAAKAGDKEAFKKIMFERWKKMRQ